MATASATRMSISRLLLEHVRRTASRLSPRRSLRSQIDARRGVLLSFRHCFRGIYESTQQLEGHHEIRNARQYGSPGFETLLRDYDIRGRQRPLQGYQHR